MRVGHSHPFDLVLRPAAFLKMKVLLISHTCQSRSEGQPKAVELAHLGVDLTVVVPRRWKHYGSWRAPQMPLEGSGFRFRPMTVRLPWSGPGQSYLHFYPGLERLLSQWQPDVIDLWEEPWSLVSAQACWLRDRVCPRARIVSETEQNVDKQLVPPFENFRAYVLGRADWVVGRSSEALEVVRRKGYDGPASVVPNAVDAEVFAPPDPAARAQTRAALGWGRGVCVRLRWQVSRRKGAGRFGGRHRPNARDAPAGADARPSGGKRPL